MKSVALKKNPTGNSAVVSRLSGASLLLTLALLVGMLTVLVVFARVVMVEYRVTRGYGEIARAEFAAAAGLADAMQLLLELFHEYPDSATFWDPAVGSSSTPGTVFAYRTVPPGGDNAGAASIRMRPLMSGARDVAAADYTRAGPSGPLAEEDVAGPLGVDINSERGGELPGGAIGMPSGSDAPETVRVPWTDLVDGGGERIGRYAFWIEDESFKLNVNTARARERGTIDAEEANGGPSASLAGLFPTVQATEIEKARSRLPEGVFLSPLQASHAEVYDAADPEEFNETYRYLLTNSSSGLDISRGGARRLDLNRVVARAFEGAPRDSANNPFWNSTLAPGIQRAIGQIREAIRSQAPDFGQRFFSRTNTAPAPTTNATAGQWKNETGFVPDDFAEQYLNRIAVNIFDYLSQSPNPVHMDSEDSILMGERLLASDLFQMGLMIQPNQQVYALGKRPIPYLTEYVMHAKQIQLDPTEYELEIDHYFEFWNMTDNPIRPAQGDLGPRPYLLAQNFPSINVHNDFGVSVQLNIPEGRDFEIRLDLPVFDRFGNETEIIFEPGRPTVLTTDPNWGSYANTLQIPNNAVVYHVRPRIPGSDQFFDTGPPSTPNYTNMVYDGATVFDTGGITNVRRYTGPSFRTSSDPTEVGELRMRGRSGGINNADWLTRVILANDGGLLDAIPYVAMARSDGGNNVIAFNRKSGRPNPQLNHFRGSFLGGTLRGGADPRAKLEAIRLSAAGDDNSALKRNGTGVNTPQGNSTLGRHAASELIQGERLFFWENDSGQLAQNSPNGHFMLQRFARPGPNGIPAMRSIGELGHVYDPARFGTNPTQNQDRRGGGLTLAVGQPDLLYAGTRTSTAPGGELTDYQLSPSRNWAAWRLADIFTVRETPNGADSAANSVHPHEIPGLYNPNGILRDGGMVLRALLEGLDLAGADPRLGDGGGGGAAFSTAGMGQLAAEGVLLQPQLNAVGQGGQALANLLASRLLPRDATGNLNPRFSPIWERGELGQLEFFQPTSERLISSSNPNDLLLHKGREELFRRLSELITPRGNTFTIHIAAQSFNRQGNPSATTHQKATVRLRPVWNAALNDNFDPASPTAVEERFGPPDAWRIEVLSIENT